MLHQLSGNDSGGAGDAIIVQRFDAKMFKFQIMNEVTVFISYSHDSDAHRERVLGLSERLRQDGIPTLLFIVPTLPRGNAAFTAPAVRYLRRWSVAGGIPTQSVTAIKLSRHSGMDRRNPDCRDANNLCHPWSLGSGDPCRNDEFFLNLMAVTQSVGTIHIYKEFFIVPTLPRGNAAFTAPAVRYLRRWSVAGGIPKQSVGTIQSTKTELNSPRKSRTIPSQITLPSTSLAFGMRCSLLGFT